MKIFVWTCDGLGASWLGAYGNDLIETPAFDQLAAESLVGDQHFAYQPGPSGQRSADWDTGRYAGGTGWTLLHALRTAGLGTWAGGSERWSAWPTHQPGLFWTRQRLGPLSARGVPRPHLRAVFGQLDPPVRPWRGPVPPTLTPEVDDEVRERLVRTFAAQVRQADDWLAAWRTWLTTVPGADEAWWIVTAGHGWPLGTHGHVGRTAALPHAELTQVPLLVRPPGGLPGGSRTRAFTQPLDLAPTLAGLLGVPVPSDLHGVDLRPLFAGHAQVPRPAAVSVTAAGWCVRTPSWSLVGPAPLRWFEQPADRWEVHDRAAHFPDRVEALARTWSKMAATWAQPGQVDWRGLFEAV
jgi:arylsulfatase A-like enzyme